MPLISMRQLLDHAAEHTYGVPAYNVNNLEQVQAVMQAAAEVGAPVILQADGKTIASYDYNVESRARWSTWRMPPASPSKAATAPGNARTGVASSSAPPAAGAMSKSSTALQVAGVVVDGAAFRCGDGSLLHVSHCQGNANDATCALTELHLPGLQMGKATRRADIAARVKGCEAGGIRYGANDKPVFVR